MVLLKELAFKSKALIPDIPKLLGHPPCLTSVDSFEFAAYSASIMYLPHFVVLMKRLSLEKPAISYIQLYLLVYRVCLHRIIRAAPAYACPVIIISVSDARNIGSGEKNV
jgi:hypothetical protein